MVGVTSTGALGAYRRFPSPLRFPTPLRASSTQQPIKHRVSTPPTNQRITTVAPPSQSARQASSPGSIKATRPAPGQLSLSHSLRSHSQLAGRVTGGNHLQKAEHHSRRALLASSLYIGKKRLAKQPKNASSARRTKTVTDASATPRSARASRPPSPCPDQLIAVTGFHLNGPFKGHQFFHQR